VTAGSPPGNTFPAGPVVVNTALSGSGCTPSTHGPAESLAGNFAYESQMFMTTTPSTVSQIGQFYSQTNTVSGGYFAVYLHCVQWRSSARHDTQFRHGHCLRRTDCAGGHLQLHNSSNGRKRPEDFWHHCRLDVSALHNRPKSDPGARSRWPSGHHSRDRLQRRDVSHFCRCVCRLFRIESIRHPDFHYDATACSWSS
jgi:hypothetical protein